METDPQRLAEIDRLFDQALDLEADQREAFVDEVRSRDARLAAEISELLRLAATKAQTLSPERILTEFWESLGEAADPWPYPRTGERIGAYRVVREIGRGGMAVVYLAERDDGVFDQQVALKFLRSAAPPGEVSRRFEQERQILASLKHPAIASLLDGGVDDRGRPFIVLEHVEGQPIDRYCDHRRLSVDQRIDLLARVAEAVAYAHRNLVVHRDIKASNIMVSDDGQVKLLDFGIAKLLDPAAAGDFAAPPTRTLARVLTPEYASPEQVRGEAVTTASDVYQLGLLLYELLTGERAHRFRKPSVTEMERVVCVQDPRRPSTLTLSEKAARLRRGTPAQLSRRLRDDLDNIVLKALRKEPERRYASPRELIDDLRRYRTGLPVTARKDTLTYRARKFAGRHRLALASVAVIALLIVGYAITLTGQTGRIAVERDRARAEAAKAREVKDFLISIFKHSDPNQALGAEATARQMLDRGSERIEEELAGQPEVQVEMLGTVGEIYRELGSYERAETLLRRASALAQGLEDAPGGPSGGGETARQSATVELLLARVLRDRGADREAGEVLDRVLESRRRELAGDPTLSAEILRERALVWRSRGEPEAAEPLLRQALAIYRGHYGNEHPEVAETVSTLGTVVRRTGDLDAAEALFFEALALRRRLLPSDHPSLGTSLSNLALTLRVKGDFERAEQLFREALAIYRKVHGPDHAWVATTLSNLGLTLLESGRYGESEAVLRQALEMRRRTLAATHPRVAASLNDLGKALRAQGRSEEAERACRQALELLEPDHPWRAHAELNLAMALEDQDRLEEAEALYRRGIERQVRKDGGKSLSMATAVLHLGRLLHKRGAEVEAESLLLDALARFRRQLPAGHPNTGTALVALGNLFAESGRGEQALPLLEEALALRAAKFGDQDPRTGEARDALARCRRALER